MYVSHLILSLPPYPIFVFHPKSDLLFPEQSNFYSMFFSGQVPAIIVHLWTVLWEQGIQSPVYRDTK